jgi:hypothetical protein
VSTRPLPPQFHFLQNPAAPRLPIDRTVLILSAMHPELKMSDDAQEFITLSKDKSRKYFGENG